MAQRNFVEQRMRLDSPTVVGGYDSEEVRRWNEENNANLPRRERYFRDKLGGRRQQSPKPQGNHITNRPEKSEKEFHFPV